MDWYEFLLDLCFKKPYCKYYITDKIGEQSLVFLPTFRVLISGYVNMYIRMDVSEESI